MAVDMFGGYLVLTGLWAAGIQHRPPRTKAGLPVGSRATSTKFILISPCLTERKNLGLIQPEVFICRCVISIGPSVSAKPISSTIRCSAPSHGQTSGQGHTRE